MVKEPSNGYRILPGYMTLGFLNLRFPQLYNGKNPTGVVVGCHDITNVKGLHKQDTHTRFEVNLASKFRWYKCSRL